MMPARALLLTWPVLLGLLGCSAEPKAPPAAPPAPPPVISSAAPPPPPTLPRYRRGECDLTPAIDDFVAGQEAERCGDLPTRPGAEEYERARACVLAAQAARRAFRLVWGRPSVDSTMRTAVAGRSVDGRYEVAWFSYDSCPSGCGDGDPMWGSARCDSLADRRAICKARAKRKKPVDSEEEEWCDEDHTHAARLSLELSCTNPVEMRYCGARGVIF